MNAAMMIVCLAGSAAVGQQQQTVFQQGSPRLQVKTMTRVGKTYSAAYYNHMLMGWQYHPSKQQPDLPRLPTTFFHDKSPIGVILKDPARFPEKNAPPVAVLGMDIGTLAAYAKPGQTFHFTERLPTFVRLSLPGKGEKRYFTYVQDAVDRGVDLKVFEGEPRDMIEKYGKEKFYQVIAVENYKVPDAVLHKELMTKEALQMLMSKTREDGIVAFHTSNRYYHLVPIIASAANELKLACVVGRDDTWRYRRNRDEDFRFTSEWVMVARHEKYLPRLNSDTRDPESGEVEWRPAKYELHTNRSPIRAKIGTKFLWTDKGEQSLRGLYHTDPEIERLHDVFRDARDFLDNPKASDFLYDLELSADRLIRTFSERSAQNLNRNGPIPLQSASRGEHFLFETPLMSVKRASAGEGQIYRYLMYNGTNIGHNYEKPAPDIRAKFGDPSRLPTTYFHDRSPVGFALKKYNWFPRGSNTYDADVRLPASLATMGPDPLAQLAQLWSEPPVAVVGLDTGTMASYARPMQTMHFTERVSDIVKLSLPDDGEPIFRYLDDALKRGAYVNVFEGEPRPFFEKQAGEAFYQAIVVSTYKLPVVTVHKELMTKEGMRLLMNKTRADGILCYHASNRYYDLVPILTSTADALGYAAVVGIDSGAEAWSDDRRNDRFNSVWVLIARRAEYLDDVIKRSTPELERGRAKYWNEPPPAEKRFVWSDVGENSFRGLYRSDPDILEFSRRLGEIERHVMDGLGVESYHYTQGFYQMLGQLGANRAAKLNEEPER